MIPLPGTGGKLYPPRHCQNKSGRAFVWTGGAERFTRNFSTRFSYEFQLYHNYFWVAGGAGVGKTSGQPTTKLAPSMRNRHDKMRCTPGEGEYEVNSQLRNWPQVLPRAAMLFVFNHSGAQPNGRMSSRQIVKKVIQMPNRHGHC